MVLRLEALLPNTRDSWQHLSVAHHCDGATKVIVAFALATEALN
jgi:hypothetical protein